MKWGFILEVGVGSAMQLNLLARPTQLLSIGKEAPQLLSDLALNL